jgi:hypothetical protein
VLHNFLNYAASTELAHYCAQGMNEYDTKAEEDLEKGLRYPTSGGSEGGSWRWENVREKIGVNVEQAARSWTAGGRPAKWDTTCHRVRQFCLLARSSKAASDPFKNVDILRTAALGAGSTHREDMLLARIKELKDQAKKNQAILGKLSRIITNLSYRYMLEGLCGFPRPGTVGLQWKTFWNVAFEESRTSNRLGQSIEPSLSDSPRRPSYYNEYHESQKCQRMW